MEETDIKYGACYSNGIYGSKWSVFQITREHADGSLTFKVVKINTPHHDPRYSPE